MNSLWNRYKTLASFENLLGIFLGGTIVAGLFFVSAAFRSGKENQSGREPVSLDPPFIELGPALQDQTLSYHLRVINRTASEMRLLGLHASCNCTFINNELTNTRIPAHGSISVPVQYHTGAAVGPVVSTVEALVDSQGRRFYAKARLEGYISADFGFEPRSLDFGTLGPGDKATKVVTFSAGALKQLAISSPRSTQPEFFTVELRTSGRLSSARLPELLVTFRAPPNRSSQLFSGYVLAETSSQRVPHLRIPARATVQPELEITPDLIVLPRSATDQVSQLTIRTIQPSRIVRAVATTENGSHEIPTLGMDTTVPARWDTNHVRRVSNAALAGAKQLNFELQVRKGTARVEARSVPVLVKSL